MKTLRELVLDPNSTKEDFIQLVAKLPYAIQDFDDDTTVGIFWAIEDIIYTAEEMGYTLNEKQAKEVLEEAKHRHDASIGINWDVLQVHIDFYVEENNITENSVGVEHDN
jgi:hypothetical protein